jgi:multiple sugar transport system ATP-binding protein
MQAKSRSASIAPRKFGLGALLERYPAIIGRPAPALSPWAGAIVRDPQVFLFDEPLSNLDAKLRVQMRTEIKSSIND